MKSKHAKAASSRAGAESTGKSRAGSGAKLGGQPSAKSAAIEVGYQAFTSDGGEEFGAVRAVNADGLVVYVENAGDFRVPLTAVEAVHSQKVILSCAKLSRALRRAIGHAHDAERPGL
jgi:hypothetical protein